MKIISNAFTLFIIIALVIVWVRGEREEQKAVELSERELTCLVANIYHEARGEDDLGQAAVAWVTLNRVRYPDYPDTICEVVMQDSQFSWFSDGRSDYMTDLPAIEKAVNIALAVSRGEIMDPTGGSLHYYAHERVRPYWSKAGYQLIVGGHTFVKLAGK
jgi:spore germination cell wall hydrolase CwlJ-like protein